ncbi:hypothetical protein FOL01_0120 [Weissella jogaejeotgali]|uniref:Uncharacterized protein n=1 Tax=Weissella jogaejeotgali TaxID=1631871 RepID=A0A1L6R8V4_9LACO|nr:hypothetical protein [Weissella jogaejeotgali]APS40979.1 hypothetical protein FOL01_0120 [Weissella jogaejeotgali]
MSNSKSNMQILRELSENTHNGDFTDEELEKMKQWKKIFDETRNEIKSNANKKATHEDGKEKL